MNFYRSNEPFVKTIITEILTLNTKLELVKVGRLSFKSNTSILKIRTVCFGGWPLSVAATATRYTERSSWSKADLVRIIPEWGSIINTPNPSVSRPDAIEIKKLNKKIELLFIKNSTPKTSSDNTFATKNTIIGLS